MPACRWRWWMLLQRVRGPAPGAADRRRAPPRDGRGGARPVPAATVLGGGAAGRGHRIDRRARGCSNPSAGGWRRERPRSGGARDRGVRARAPWPATTRARCRCSAGGRCAGDMDRGYTGAAAGSGARDRCGGFSDRPLWALMAREGHGAGSARHRPDLVLATKAPFTRRRARCARSAGAAAAVALIYPRQPVRRLHAARRRTLGTLAALRPCLHLGPPPGVAARRRAAWPPPRTCRSRFDPGDYGADGPRVTPACGARRTRSPSSAALRQARGVADGARAGSTSACGGSAGALRSMRAPAGALRTRRARPRAAAAAIYRGSRARASTCCTPTTCPAHNMRTFEIPPCGAVMLSGRPRRSRRFFEPDRACLTGRRSRAALRAQAERALADRALARAIAAGGRARRRPPTRRASARSSAISVSPAGCAVGAGAGRDAAAAARDTLGAGAIIRWHLVELAGCGRLGRRPVRVLDAGCGRGEYVAAAGATLSRGPARGLGGSKAGRDGVAGFAPRAARRGVARDSARGRSSRERSSRTSAPFDGVVCVDVLEHVPDDGQFLAELATVVRPSGRGIVHVTGDTRSDIRSAGRGASSSACCWMAAASDVARATRARASHGCCAIRAGRSCRERATFGRA